MYEMSSTSVNVSTTQESLLEFFVYMSAPNNAKLKKYSLYTKDNFMFLFISQDFIL